MREGPHGICGSQRDAREHFACKSLNTRLPDAWTTMRSWVTRLGCSAVTVRAMISPKVRSCCMCTPGSTGI